MIEFPRLGTLTRDVLEEQRDLSAATRFAQWHQAHTVPPQTRQYRNLIPLTKPLPGQQYAFEVDLDKCSGCKACVSACHSLNGLDEGEAWREVGLLVSDDWRHPFQQTITTACHHCADPACLKGCPVLAYDKHPVTGIVRHLDDQCIGCQYCVLKCPYDVPQYSPRRGIVRKCDLCSHRLAAEEAPACAQACPHEAIRITLVDTAAITNEHRNRNRGRQEEEEVGRVQLGLGNGKRGMQSARCGVGNTERGAPNGFLPDSPAPDYTLPTTRYKTAKQLSESLRAADREELRPQPAHTPLVFMLVFSQLSVGLFCLEPLLGLGSAASDTAAVREAQRLAALAAGGVALFASVLHLGRPLGAWRAFLGLGTSWLSREIVCFGCFLLSAIASATVGSGAPRSLVWVSALLGLAGVFCSAMLYADTRRDFWRWAWTGGKFLGTTLLLGAAGTLLFSAAPACSFAPGLVLVLTPLILVAGLFKLAVEHRVHRHRADDDFSPLHKTALLLAGKFGPRNRCRIACGIAGALFLPALLGLETMNSEWGPHSLPGTNFMTLQTAVLFLLCFTGELMERRLFFIAVQPVKMPGAIVS